MAGAIDLIVEGRVASAADMLMQKFPAVVYAKREGWGAARHLKLIPSLACRPTRAG